MEVYREILFRVVGFLEMFFFVVVRLWVNFGVRVWLL